MTTKRTTNGQPPSSRAAARELLRLGYAPLPVPGGAKGPVLPAWQQLRIKDEDIDAYFKEPCNVGLLTGEPSGGLTDVDLDSAEAIGLAAAFLPPTKMRHGRPSKPGSHWWYVATGVVPAYTKFTDVDSAKSTLVELRTGGHQTLVPPSLHPGGERYSWDGPLEPAQVHGADLERAVRTLATATLLARHWPKERGSRHDIANALAGMLLRAEWDQARTAEFIGAVARVAGDEEATARTRDVAATARSLAAGKRATGAPTLDSLIGRQVVSRVRDWLRLGGDTAYSAYSAYDELPEKRWPDPLAAAAFHGIAGEFVRLLEPHTEADLVAVLSQFLVAYGNCVGRGPYFRVEADEHHLNLFGAIVGVTSKGRKGTSWGQVRGLFWHVDQDWTKGSLATGLSSGEGLIWAVRDPIEKTEPIKKKGIVQGYQTFIGDPGIEDKRLLVVETELASALRVLGREGNILSAVVRSAWDTGNLRTMTKHSPARATDAHISILGHITREELVRYLDTTEAGNGFANRFLWLCVRRSKLLPEGGKSRSLDMAPVQQALAGSIRFARSVGEVTRDQEARELWCSVYPDLSDGKAGLFGAVVSRAEAQVTRLSAVYALLDGTCQIQRPHLEAALALWRYAEDSARFIFGDSLGDDVADAVLRGLRSSPPGLTRDEIRDLLGRNQSSGRIARALTSLLEGGLARFHREETGGRPAERWFATSGDAVNAVNAERGSAEERYRVNRVAHGDEVVASPSADGGTPGDNNDDEVTL